MAKGSEPPCVFLLRVTDLKNATSNMVRINPGHNPYRVRIDR